MHEVKASTSVILPSGNTLQVRAAETHMLQKGANCSPELQTVTKTNTREL